MGFDTKLVISGLNQDLVCPICSDLVEDPVACKHEKCEQIYCFECAAKLDKKPCAICR